MKKGFTLIELLVVVLIIGILSAVALPQYTRAVEKSRATQAMTLVKAIADAQKVYYLANGTYATKFEDLDIDMPWTETGNSVAYGDFRYYALLSASPRYYIQATYIKDSSAGWLINYYLDTETLACVTPKSNTKGNHFCKGFSSVIVPCATSGYNCYVI